jgi:hypothetical protein
VTAAGSARGTVTKSGDDDRYRLVEVHVEIDARLEPRAADAAALIAKSERDCFVGASLKIEPEYQWRVS